jgi:hypothetical protein
MWVHEPSRYRGSGHPWQSPGGAKIGDADRSGPERWLWSLAFSQKAEFQAFPAMHQNPIGHKTQSWSADKAQTPSGDSQDELAAIAAAE